MKPILLLPPGVALTIAGIWLGIQHQAISTLEQESEVLQKAITARSSGSQLDSASRNLTSATKAAAAKEPLDWKKISAQLLEMEGTGGGAGDMRSMMKFQQRLQAMSKEELVAALDEIATLDLPQESRDQMEQMLIGPLALKDPELVLTKFIDRIQENHGMISWQLANAMQEWAKKDPASAIAWFDQQITAGKFDSKSLDGKSKPRIQFEGNLINILLSSDPDAAGRRLAVLPEDQRDEALMQWSGEQLKDEDQPAFAKLVRDQLPQKDQAKALGQKASALVNCNEGYSKVTEFLDRIQAPPAERTACVEQAAESKLFNTSLQKAITRENLDAMREWVTAQAPESTSTATGKALANASYNQNVRKIEFSEAANLAFDYDAGDGTVVRSFLAGWQAVQNKEEIRVLANKISDPKRREEILKNLE